MAKECKAPPRRREVEGKRVLVGQLALGAGKPLELRDELALPECKGYWSLLTA